MPPKRKASTTTDDVQPAPKRPLRSNKTDEHEYVSLPLPQPKPRRSKRATVVDDATTGIQPQPQDASVASRTRRGALRSVVGDTLADKTDPGPSRPRVTRQKKPITTNRRGNHALVEGSDEEELDELLLSPSKRSSARPVTPPPLGTPKATTPRFVLDCVEIRTPRLRPVNGSPAYAQPAEAAGAPPRSSTPSPIKRIGPPRSRSKLRPVEPIRPSPEDAAHAAPAVSSAFPPSTPKKQSQTRTPTASPSKQRPTTLQASPSRRSKGLDPILYPCLVAQQRAILRALHDVPDIAQEHNNEDEDAPTNTIALEELSSLLRGTVLRGEGNSCLLIGPRGSGKTRVGCALYHVSCQAHAIFRSWRKPSLLFRKDPSLSVCRGMHNRMTAWRYERSLASSPSRQGRPFYRLTKRRQPRTVWMTQRTHSSTTERP